MAVSLPSSRNTGRGRRRGYGRMAEINVTPMVDVMLVLLVIFMVAAPMLTVGVPVDLPKANAKQITTPDDKPITISIQRNGDLFINDSQIEASVLLARLQAISHNNTEARIYVRGDKGVPYGSVMDVMSTLSQAGFSKVALIANVPDHKP